MTVASTMQAQLVPAQLRIHKLEAERQSFKKKIEHLLRKYGEEKPTWQRGEYQKIHVVIDDLTKELNEEKKNRRRLEILNSKLVNELANVKSAAKQFRQDYEEEKKARELTERVCNELTNKIAEDKAEIEAMKTKSIKIRKEVEEERKMLQMAEVWREERVRIKLIDAKLVLEHKYCQMNKLMRDFEDFLSSGSTTLDVMKSRKAQLIRQAAKSVNVKDTKEFFYVPPKPCDIYTIFEELRQTEANESAIEPCDNQSSACDVSKIQAANSIVDNYKNQNLLKHSNVFIDDNCGLEECGIGWETVTHADDQISNCSPKGSDINGQLSQCNNAWQSSREYNKNAGQHSPNTQISEVCSVSTEKSMQKTSSISKLWRSSPRNGKCHTMTSDDSNGRLLNATISSLGTAPKRKSCDGSLVHRNFVEQWSSPDLVNPYVIRGMKGYNEWPRGIKKNCLKLKLLEARMESQKAQLHNVVKQTT